MGELYSPIFKFKMDPGDDTVYYLPMNGHPPNFCHEIGSIRRFQHLGVMFKTRKRGSGRKGREDKPRELIVEEARGRGANLVGLVDHRKGTKSYRHARYIFLRTEDEATLRKLVREAKRLD